MLAPSFTNVVLVSYLKRLRNGRKSQRIQDDYDECLRYELYGTPTFDLNLCVLRIPFAATNGVQSPTIWTARTRVAQSLTINLRRCKLLPLLRDEQEPTDEA